MFMMWENVYDVSKLIYSMYRADQISVRQQATQSYSPGRGVGGGWGVGRVRFIQAQHQ